MPLPFTFVLSISISSSRMQYSACAANASFSSIRSTSPISIPAFPSAFRTAGTGPVPIIAGSTPATPRECQRSLGRSPSSAAFAADIITTAAAPSLMLDALPAVTLPSGLNTGRSVASLSSVVSARGPSSCDTTTGSPRRCATLTGVICSLNRPFCIAATAR